MSCVSFDNICMLCFDSNIILNEDISMNRIIEHNELIEYKHCLNIKIHPQCLCLWFIKHNDECLICRNELDVSHNAINDEKIFIVNTLADDFSTFDIIYPCKYISVENQRRNTQYLSPVDISNDITYSDDSITHNVYETGNNVYDTGNNVYDTGNNVYDNVETNFMRVMPIIDLCNSIIIFIIMFICVLCITLVSHSLYIIVVF